VQDLVREIATGAAVRAVGGLLKMEDVAVGTWVEQAAEERHWEVQYINHSGFNKQTCAPEDITSHFVTPERMRCIFEHRDETTCCSEDS